MQYRKSEAKEAARAKFRGLWAALPTPFTPGGAVDEAGLRRNMRRLTDELHIDGVFCTGVMGEFWSLTKEERKRCVEIVVEEAKGKCLVIAHTCHHSAHETVELSRHAAEVGADFIILMNPYYPPANEAMVYEWFSFVASRVDIGIWMFDPPFAGYGLSPELTARIADLENVCGLKLPRPREHYLAVKKLCGDKIVISDPSEPDWLTLMRDYGQKVHQSSPSPYLFQTPASQPLREYTELGLAGRFAEAQAISDRLPPLRQLYDRWMNAPWIEHKIMPMATLKAWCEMLGMAGGPVRPPLLQITAAERAELRADLERVGLIAPMPRATAAQ
jgi:4-hydroxy-tetrahydrodipicolinate synthase